MPDFSRLPPQVFAHCTVKQANPLRGPAAKTVQMALKKMLGGLKTYGKRLTGDSTLKPIRQRVGLIRDIEKDVAAQLQNTNPINVAVNSLRYAPGRTAIDALGYGRGYLAGRSRDTAFEAYKQLNRQSLDALNALFKEHEAIRKTRLYTGGAASGTALGGIGAAAYNNSKQSAASPILNGLDIKGPSAAERMLFKVWYPTHKFLFNMLRDRSKPIGGGIRKMPQDPAPLAKQSAALPEPTCRGMTKKVTMPSDSKQQPDLDPEGVQMSAQDYRTQKEARLGSLLKLLAKGVYKTPRSLKALGLGGGGGYIAGRQHGHQMGLDDGREDAAKTLTDLFQKKQAFMGLGALAGMATAPNKEEEDLSIGRGALRGVGTGLGVGTGAITGGALGGLGGAGLGAVLGALARLTPGAAPDAISRGAAGFGSMGMLAGGLGGGVYGGYKGNKATKALLDKTAPISDKKKDKKDDDKDVKEAAAAVYTRLLQNNPTIKSAVGPMQPLASAAKAKMLSPATPKPAMPQVARPQAAMPQLPAANDPARKAYERHTIGRMYHQHGAPAARYEHFQKGVDPKAFAHFTPEQRKMLDKDVMQRLYNQHGGAEGFMDAAQMPMQ